MGIKIWYWVFGTGYWVLGIGCWVMVSPGSNDYPAGEGCFKRLSRSREKSYSSQVSRNEPSASR